MFWHTTKKTYENRVMEVIQAMHTHLPELPDANIQFQYLPFPGGAHMAVDTKLCPLEIDRTTWQALARHFSVHHQ